MIKSFSAMLMLLMLLAGSMASPTPDSGAPALAAELMTASLTPSGDSYVDEGAPDTNFANSATLVIERDTLLQERYALIQFDLSGLPTSAQVMTATLELALIEADPNELPVQIGIERVSAGWSAASVSWASRPASVATGFSSSVGSATGGYSSWDVTALVRDWALAGGLPNYGLALRGPGSAFSSRGFGSAEFGKPPRLVIRYTSGPIALDLRVALEWEPGSANGLAADIAVGCPSPPPALRDSYRENLAHGLREAAQYLYGFSEGQITLGKVTIGSDEAAWQNADIRILASSGYRPSAFVGGIVDAPMVGATPGGRPVLYYPAPILLGRLWDGSGARCGGWGEPEGWRSLGHELGHYALFLYDQYFSIVDGSSQYCSSTGLRFLRPGLDRAQEGRTGLADTLMAYHYTADKLRIGGLAATGAGRRLACAGSPHDHIYLGKTDWEVARNFYPALHIPALTSLRTDWDTRFAAVVETPGIFTVNWERPASHADTSARVALEPLTGDSWHGEAYLLSESGPGQPLRIIGQGWRLPGEPTPPPFLGVQPSAGQRAAIFVEDYGRNLRQATAAAGADLDLSALNSLATTPSSWRPSMQITPTLTSSGSVFAEVTALNVRLTDCAAQTSQVDLAYCPAGGSCSAPVRVERGADGAFRHSFAGYPIDGQSEPPAIYGYIYARSVDSGEEAISTYQLGGGVGPAHIDGHAPLVEGQVGLDVATSAAGSSGDNRVLFSQSAVCVAAGLPAGVKAFIGAPISIQVSVAAKPQLGQPGRSWGAPASTDPALRVRLFYDQALLNALSVDERRLVLLRLGAVNGLWQVVPVQGRSPELNWIAAQPQGFGGDGEIFALAILEERLYLPLLR